MQSNKLTREISGCMVLSARQAVALPLFPMASLQGHITGSFNGKVGTTASFQEEVFLPSKGKNFYFSSTSILRREEVVSCVSLVNDTEDQIHFRGSFERSMSSIKWKEPSLISVEQRLPFGFIGLHSVDVNMYMYGIYNSRCSLLYWTNTENFEDLLRQENGKDFWMYRFRPRKNFSTVLYTKRICSRWFRWSENIPETSQRFQALEGSIFPNYTTS